MKTSILLLAATAALCLPSCNTFAGIGRDVKSLGQGVENQAYGKTWSGNPRPVKSASTQQSAPSQNSVPHTINR